MNWRELNAQISNLREEEVERLLHEELDGPRRATFLVRLHQRYTALRSSRERRQMLVNVSDKSPD